MKRTEPTTHILRGHAYTPACKTDIRRTIELAKARMIAERMRQIEPRREERRSDAQAWTHKEIKA